MDLGLHPAGVDPESGLPSYQIVITPEVLPGYLPADAALPPLGCVRCGALVVNVSQHNDWHASLGR